MDCSVCSERITEKRFLVECPFCEDGSVCVECAGKHIVSTEKGSTPVGERGCMICKKMWDLDFIEYMFGLKLAEQYLDMDKTKLLEREKGLMTFTQPLVDYVKFKNDITAQNNILADIKASLIDRIEEVDDELSLNRMRIRNHKPEDMLKVRYVLACPAEIEDPRNSEDPNSIRGIKNTRKCKGFIDARTWTCSLCSTTVCNKCHIITGVVNSPENITNSQGPQGRSKSLNKFPKVHQCKASDVSTVNFIMKDTKPCPACAFRIQKMNGCPQMFCTNCMTAFDWETLKILTGNIHNPHYYDFVRDGRVKGPDRALGDIPCGGIPRWERIGILMTQVGISNYTKLASYHEMAGEIRDYLEALPELKSVQDLFTDLRIKYMMDEIETEDEYKEAVYDLESYVRKCVIEKDALETLVSIFSGRFKDLSVRISAIMEARSGKIKAVGPSTSISRKKKKSKNALLPLKQRKKNLASYLDESMEEFQNTVEMINHTFLENDIEIIDLSFLEKADATSRKIPAEHIHYRGFRSEELTNHLDDLNRRDYDSDSSDSDSY